MRWRWTYTHLNTEHKCTQSGLEYIVECMFRYFIYFILTYIIHIFLYRASNPRHVCLKTPYELYKTYLYI